ncbi:MAG: hypothetical protein IJI37_02565, partial [Opitutales bacterium]|nr:hypothetical protein [Opitutales bacterium]
MKKSLYITIAILSFCALANGATIEITPTSTSRANVNVTHDSSDTLQLNSTDSWYSYKVGNNTTTTYAQVIVKNGDNAGAANFALGTLIVDANTLIPNETALSASSWSMNYFTLKLRNSASEITPITVNFGSELNIRSTADVVQQQYIYFEDTTYNVSATTINVGNKKVDYTSVFTVGAASTVDWSGTNFNISSNGVLTIYGTLKSAGKIELQNEGATLNIKNGADLIFTAGKNFKMAEGTTMNIGANSNLTFVRGNNAYLNGTITTHSAMTFMKITTATGKFTQTAGGVTFNRPATFDYGADWTIYEKITLKGDDADEAHTAKLTVNDGANFTFTTELRPRIIFAGYSEIELNTETPFLDDLGDPVGLVTTTYSRNSKIYVNANQRFKFMHTNGGTAELGSGKGDLDVYLADETTFSIVGQDIDDRPFKSTN